MSIDLKERSRSESFSSKSNEELTENRQESWNAIQDTQFLSPDSIGQESAHELTNQNTHGSNEGEIINQNLEDRGRPRVKTRIASLGQPERISLMGFTTSTTKPVKDVKDLKRDI